MQAFKYQVGKILAIGLILIGILFILVMFTAIFGDDPDRSSQIGGTAIFGILPLATGILLFIISRKGQRKFLMNKYEQQIFRIASQNEGHLTTTQLAMQTDLNLKESKKVLETMQMQGYCELKVSSNAAIVFYFRELDKGDDYSDSELLN